MVQDLSIIVNFYIILKLSTMDLILKENNISTRGGFSSAAGTARLHQIFLIINNYYVGPFLHYLFIFSTLLLVLTKKKSVRNYRSGSCTVYSFRCGRCSPFSEVAVLAAPVTYFTVVAMTTLLVYHTLEAGIFYQVQPKRESSLSAVPLLPSIGTLCSQAP